MARLVVVSNRVALPRERLIRAGGLAVALREALTSQGGLWFGWSGEVTATPKQHCITAGRTEYCTLDLTPEDHKAFYLDFSNSTLWPLFHYRPGLIDFRRKAFEGYIRVNTLFAQRLAEQLRPDDVVWVHDYHFIPLAAELRRLGVTCRIGYFQHIPFPAPEMLVALPRHERLLNDLCQYDLIGLQTAADVRALRNYITLETGAISSGADTLTVAGGREVTLRAFPIGIDTESFAELAAAQAGSLEVQRLRQSLTARQLIIGVDRLDYSKGIPQRFEAFHTLLATHPQHRGAVTLMQIAPVSRGEVPEYRRLRRELDALSGHINGKYAEFDWVPVRYLNKSFSRQALAGFYRSSRVGVVTPLRDGMNLVAKEYVAAQDPDDPGILVLSRFAGAAAELTDALLVNPFDVDQTADAMHRALGMPRDERRARWRSMMQVLRQNTITRWREDFVATLRALHPGAQASLPHLGAA